MRIFHFTAVIAAFAVALGHPSPAMASDTLKIVLDSDWFFPQRADVVQTHEFDVSARILLGTAWTIPMALDHLRVSHAIFQQCGVTLKMIHLSLSDVPSELRIADYGSEGRDRRLIRTLSPSVRPAIYFVKATAWSPSSQSIINIPMSPAYAYYRKLGAPSEVVDATFVSPRINDPAHLEGRRNGYDTVAHELGHILTDDGHVDAPEGNLMANGVTDGSPDLTQAQCEAIKRHPLVRVKAR